MEKTPDSIRDQIIDNRNMDFSYNTLHRHAELYDQQSGRTIKVPYESFMSKYKNALSKIIVESKLSDAEKREYWYRPKTVSQVLYGSTEYWHTLLVLNQCTYSAQFIPEVMKYYDPSYLKEMLNYIMIFEDIV